MSDSILNIDQAKNLESALKRTRDCKRGEWTSEDSDQLFQTDILSKILDVLHGYAEIRKINHLINRGAKIAAWKKIKLGVGLDTVSDLSETFKRANCVQSIAAIIYLDEITFPCHVARREVEIELVVLSTMALTGNFKGSTINEILTAAVRLGLDKCPIEVGPQLRLQYLDQPANECVYVAVPPKNNSGNRPGVFVVETKSIPILDFFYYDPKEIWGSDVLWVFCRR